MADPNSVLDYVNTGLQGVKTIYDLFTQKKTWEREDNAVQRRVEDLKKAGLSPTLAAGSAAAVSSPINVSPPQFTSANYVQRADAQKAVQAAAQSKAETRMIEANAHRQEMENLITQKKLGLLVKNPTGGKDYATWRAETEVENEQAAARRQINEADYWGSEAGKAATEAMDAARNYGFSLRDNTRSKYAGGVPGIMQFGSDAIRPVVDWAALGLKRGAEWVSTLLGEKGKGRRR